QLHAPHGLLGDIKMMVLHLRAFTLLGPAVELVLQAFVWRLRFVSQNRVPSDKSRWSIVVSRWQSKTLTTNDYRPATVSNSSKNDGYDTPAASAPVIVVAP